MYKLLTLETRPVTVFRRADENLQSKRKLSMSTISSSMYVLRTFPASSCSKELTIQSSRIELAFVMLYDFYNGEFEIRRDQAKLAY